MTGKVAIITGGSQGIGADLVAGYRARGWAVVATASTITPSQDPGALTVAGDIADPATAGQIVGAALERFGRLDTLVNNVGVFISKPFTGYTAADYARVVGVRAHLPPGRPLPKAPAQNRRHTTPGAGSRDAPSSAARRLLLPGRPWPAGGCGGPPLPPARSPRKVPCR